ncbi:MAG: hypothetical protein Q7S87_00355 [Agitococcus sp.]|nr:hypothetical protein [Agitococcus sp.]
MIAANFKYLTANGQLVHNGLTTPHCVVGLGGLNLIRRTTASLCGFFVRAAWLVRVMTGCVGASQDALVSYPSPPTLHSLSPLLGGLGDRFTTCLDTRTIMANGVQLRGVWCYKLPDPFHKTTYFPLSNQELAEMLDISPKTAVRICQDERPLKIHELVYLQMKIFGYIPDKDFGRYKVFFRDGHLYCHNVPNFEMSAGELGNLYIWKTHFLQTKDALEAAKARVKELEAPPKPSNLIDFKKEAAKRQALSHNKEA